MEYGAAYAAPYSFLKLKTDAGPSLRRMTP
jgi:hypothetical protein